MTAPSLPHSPAESAPQSLCQEFESAWKQIVAGPPRVEDYLARLSPTERGAALETLREIEKRFRSLLASEPPAPPLAAQTIDHQPANPEPAGATVDESQGVAIPLPTVDESQGVPIPGGTVDEASGQPIPTAKRGTPRPAVPGYVILSELGRGGMGVVYKAHHLALNRVVALKMILAGAHVEEAQRVRFVTEAQAVAKLQHPGVVQVFEINEFDGLPYFSLEFVSGGTLQRKIKGTPQPPTEAARIMATIARAVQAAHDRGIIHRDLKPANVLLTPEGAPKITDFGLARRLEGDAGQTQSGSVLGTPNYMAPEQARGDNETVGPLADVYALGAMLYEMLTGRPPFQGSTVYETLELVQRTEPVPPLRQLPRLPRDLDTICLKCLQKDPARRYPNATALADDLDRFLEGRPITARPVSATERVWRLCKRNPVVSGLTAVVGLLLLGAAIGGPIVAVLFKEQRDRAEAARAGESIAREQEKVTSDGALIAMRGNLQTMQDELKMRPDLVGLREKLTGYVANHLEKLSVGVRSRSLKDRSTAMANVRMGDLYIDLQKLERSKQHYDVAHEILEAAERQQPDSPVAKRNLAAVKNKLADVALLMNHGAEAKTLAEAALGLRTVWKDILTEEAAGKRSVSESEEREPATLEDVHVASIALAQSHGLLGNASIKLGDPQAALDHYRKSKQYYDSVPANVYASYDPPWERRTLELERIAVVERLGKSSLQAGRTAEARKLLEEAFRHRLERRKKEPTAIDTGRDLAFARADMGDLELIYDSNPIAAVGWYRLAVAGLEATAKQYPNVPTYARDQAFGDYRMGYACQRVAQLNTGVASAAWVATAQFHYERARQVLEKIARTDPKNAFIQTRLLLAEARCGRRKEAVARIEALLKQSPEDSGTLFQAACGYALAGESEELALTALEKAVARGWKDLVALERDPDLDPIRGHPRLVALQTKLRTQVAQK